VIGMTLLKFSDDLNEPFFLSFYLIHLGPLLQTPLPTRGFIYFHSSSFYDTLGFFFHLDDLYDLATAALTPNTRSVISHQYP